MASKKKILLIEDEPNIIDIYETVLKKAGFCTRVIKYGYQAKEELEKIKNNKEKRPDLVLLDLVLPDINGMEILKLARGEKGISDIPFFILTNYTDPEIEKVGRKLKVEKYLLKTDLIPSQLIKIINDWFKK